MIATSLKDLAKEIHNDAIEKGFWHQNRRLPEHITLMHSELSEAFEAWRDGVGPIGAIGIEGWAVELIDCMIVILDVLGAYDIPIDKLLQEKMKKNKERPFRHGRNI